MGVSLLHYRPWRGAFHNPALSIWPIARISLRMMFRRKLFWVLYGLGLLFFFMFFFGQYLLAWTESQAGGESISVFAGVKMKPEDIISPLRKGLHLDGTSLHYRNFFRYQASMIVIVLALAGSVLVGNDFQFGSIPFYLSKPLGPWHYLLGKCLAVAVLVNLMTTVPALVLYAQYGLLTSWQYFTDKAPLLLGIIAYGLVLTVSLSLILVATAGLLRRTVPMIMAWTTMFVFLRFLASALVDGLHHSRQWRLIDLWNDTYLLGNYCLGVPRADIRPFGQPPAWEAACVLGAVCLVCLIYLSLRIRAVEIVR